MALDQPGTYRIESIWNECGYEKSEGVIEVIPALIQRISLAKDTYCQGGTVSVSFTAVAQSTPVGSLTFYAGERSDGTGPKKLLTVVTTQTGTYELFSAANACGRGQASGGMSVTVLPKTEVMIEALSANFYPTVVPCKGKTVRVNMSTTGTFGPDNVFTAYIK